MLHVALSTSVCQRGKSGVAVYLFGLIDGLLRSCPDVRLSIFGLESDRPLFERWIEKGAVWHGVPEFWRRAVFNVFWHHFLFPGRLRATGVEVVHIPSYRRMMAWSPCAQVATVHDCAAFHVRKKYDVARMFYGQRVVPLLARRVQKLITVSHATAVDVEKYFRRPLSEIAVVWNGIDHERFRPADAEAVRAFRRKRGLDEPYLIYVARLEHPAKNHVRLIEAFEKLAGEGSDMPHHLVLAGADWHGAEVIHARAEASPLNRRIHRTGFVAVEDLPLWYAGAEMLVYPSLFEGFGLPPVEAMACGCPVVCSSRGSLGEIVGDAARIVNPESPEEIAQGIRDVLKDREGWRARGLARSRMFDWNRCAEQTAAIYREVWRQ